MNVCTGESKPQDAKAHEKKEGCSRKNSKNKKHESTNTTAGEFFESVAISVGSHRLELFLRTKERLVLYASIQFKNR